MADAILEAWNPGERSTEAIVNAIAGRIQSCRTSASFRSKNSGPGAGLLYPYPTVQSYHQGTIGAFSSYMDCSYEPRYCFGHGLSYTSFQYSDMKITGMKNSGQKQEKIPSVPPDGLVQVSLKVKNTGGWAGEEVVQIYLKDLYASMLRPVMELAGFRRIFLEAGEEKEVIFDIHASQNGWSLTECINGRWKKGRSRFWPVRPLLTFGWRACSISQMTG